MTYVVILSTLAMGIGILLSWWVHSRNGMQIVVGTTHAPGIATSPGQVPPSISVIIPARNEGRNIRHCVQALLAQTYPNYEVIVVDDRSTDDTLPILKALAEENTRLHIVHGVELPPDWAGKPHALVQGVAASHGEWLCFVDADTFATPDLIWSTFASAVQHQADMFSILTEQELGSFWEKTILPLVFLGLSFGFPAEKVNDPKKPDAISNGQFILIKRSVYEAIGGHAAVKDRVDEDKAIAVIVKRSGYRLVVADGRRLASTRMYTSLPEMWEGWTKNIFLGLRDRLWLLGFGAFLGLLVSLALPLWLLGGLVWLSAGGGIAAAVVTSESVLLWAHLLWMRIQACRGFDIPVGYALTLPLGALIFTAMILASAFNVISGRGVTWKGRRYQR